MSVFGKDLFDFQRSHTNTKVEFGASGYWVEMVPEMQPYGTVLTEILNLDVTPFQKLLDRLNTAVHEKNYDDAPRAWVQTSTSQPSKYSASRRAASWACRGSTAAPFGKL